MKEASKNRPRPIIAMLIFIMLLLYIGITKCVFYYEALFRAAVQGNYTTFYLIYAGYQNIILAVIPILYLHSTNHGNSTCIHGRTYKVLRIAINEYIQIIPLLSLYYVTFFVIMLAQSTTVSNHAENISTTIMRLNDSSVIGIIIYTDIIVISPAAEELYFRGYLYGAVKIYSDVRLSTITTSLLFALWHGSIGMLLPLFVLGCACAKAFEKSNSVVASIVVHCIHNVIILTAIHIIKWST